MSQFIRLFSCKEHSFDAALIKSADIDIEASADGSDIFNIKGFIRHDRTSSACKQYVCHIVDCYIIGNVVYQRY